MRVPKGVASRRSVQFTAFMISLHAALRVPGLPWLWASLFCALARGQVAPSPEAASFAARFAHPPAEARIIKIIHGWPDDFPAQDRLIGQLQQQGFGGVVCNVSFDHYLASTNKWSAFTRAVASARKAGFALWLYDERGYPSGNAGGLVLREHPEWEAQGLLVADTICDAGPVELAIPPGTLVLAVALPLEDGLLNLRRPTDVSSHLREGKLLWQAPAGRWHVMVFTRHRLYEGTHADGNLFEKMPYVNLLVPEATQKFIELTHQAYADHMGGDLGRSFVATFTDEPSLMSCFLKPMPWRPLPWAPNLPDEFQIRRGYSLDLKLLPALVGQAGARGARFRSDFWRTIGEMISSHYFGQIQERCRALRIPSGGHLLMEEGLVVQVPLYGDFFSCLRRLDAPSMDCLTSVPSEVPWFVARLVASAAELEGRRMVMSETSDHGQVWRGPGDQRPKRTVTEAEIRGTCNRLIVAGVNAITSYYSFAELSNEALVRLNDWVGRCCTALVGGHQAADIALLYPVQSVWPKFYPARHWASDSPEASAVEHSWRAAAEALFADQRDFTVVDERTLAEAKPERGALTHGDLRWRVVILPATDSLPAAAWKNLDRWVRQGGVLIALGALPANDERSFPSRSVQALARRWFGQPNSEPIIRPLGSGTAIFLPPSAEALLPVVLQSVLERDVEIQPPHSPVRATHRHIDNQQVYFLINDSAQPWRGQVSLRASGRGEQWDPGCSQIVQTNLDGTFALALEPYGGTVLRFPDCRVPRLTHPRSDTLPDFKILPGPTAEPALIRGEFVNGSVAPDLTLSQPGRPVWRATAKLTRGQVDTFLFTRFSFAKPEDLSQMDCLVLDVWLPAGQRTSTRLLVVVQEKEGGDFLADTGCALGVPGHHRLFIPVSSLQLAGWSKDPDGLLDLRRTSEVRVGWGGYFGQAGEAVEFSVALPQVGTAKPPTPR